ncbi:MAG: radical SAM protein [Bacteroidales bacterium]|nr:radical SAM protein [Bacteroidales bacterium]
MYKHLFGPVPSRRLGMSLGVDLIPHKICSLNCVYCECGRTTNLTHDRKEYVPVKDVFSELEDFFKNNPDPEYITFSGAGEPTLHSHIGEVLGFLKRLRPQIPLAVLTNGSLFSDSEVRKELMPADLVLPSLDAATDAAFRKINRPVRNFTIDKYIQGLIDFSNEFEGEIWMEVLILPGYNDDMDNINALKEALLKIRLNRIQLNTLDRPGTVEGLRAATWAELERIVKHWELDHVEIIAPAQDRQDVKSYRTDVESAILETISRRPCTLQDLEQILGLHINEINKYLGVLEEAGKVETVEQERGTFYQVRN